MKQKSIQAVVAVAVIAALVALVGCSSAPVATTTSSSEAKTTSTSATATSATASKAESTNANAGQTSGSNQSSQQAPAATPQPNVDTSKFIGEEAAKTTALNDSGVDQATVYDLEVDLDLDDIIPNYDVSFKSNGMEYDYDINAETGEILNSRSEVND